MTEWTKEQRKAIELTGRNLLVSAAAGSGKTAVLIERIMEKLTRPSDPVNITELLVVTFTRAAASEMRVRIRQEINKSLEDPTARFSDCGQEDRRKIMKHLQKQLLLLDQAEICTIDSFCSNILRNYFYVINLDPATRLVEQNEMVLIENDEVEKLLEEEFAREDSDIGFVSDYFGAGKTADYLAEEILSLYRFSRNSVFPERTLEAYLEPYRIENVDTLRRAPWNQDYFRYIEKRILGYAEDAKLLFRLASLEGGPSYFKGVAAEDEALLCFAAEAKTYEEIRKRTGIDFRKSPSKPKDFEGSAALAEQAKAIRERYRKGIKSLYERFEATEEEVVQEFETARPAAEALVRLTREFMERIAETKRKSRIMDFMDLEHHALHILTKDGRPSEIAGTLLGRYEEIMIDEYQDSNELQEAILTSFARRDPDTGEAVNVFMVGDIKQSIYRFRQANPELFNEKYKSYSSKEDSNESQKVELTANFRSRPGVTRAVNYFFRTLMREEIGGVEYTEEVELNPKGVFPETTHPVGNDTTILLVDPAGADGSEMPSDEAEAHLIAQEILKLLDDQDGIFVKEGRDGIRKATYRDVVILLRSMTRGDTFQEVLESYGIPVYMKRKTGFYDTFEVQFVIQYLSLIDNPVNDVALASVLRSPIFGFSSEELADIKVRARQAKQLPGFYGAILLEAGEDTDTGRRIASFLEGLSRYRTLSEELRLSELIRTLYRETGLLYFVQALPGGPDRTGNLNELIEKAEAFENTSLKGVFNFIRYIEKTRERSDEGEVGAAGENENLVRIMSIHNSKGLEFPIVFLSDTAKSFNKQDEQDRVLRHAKLGIGLKIADPKKRTLKSDSYYRNVLRATIETENLGEELRVLYVAMTRAKEKLYLTGALEKSDYVLEEMKAEANGGSDRVSFNEIISAKSFLGWLLKAYRGSAPVIFRPVLRSDSLLKGAAGQAVTNILTKAELFEAMGGEEDPKALGAVQELLGYPYQYDDLFKVYATMSVSSLKNAHQTDSEPVQRRTERMKGDARLTGAARGTLYHKILEEMDPEDEIGEVLKSLRKEGLISEIEQGTIDGTDIDAFWKSPIGKRFSKAFRNGKGYREQQFIIGRPAEEIFPECKIRSQGELVMIQGIIDMYFEEEDGLVLVDYKTDRVKDASVLVEAYEVQLNLYETALQMMTGKPVKEKWIYSFALRKEIRV